MLGGILPRREAPLGGEAAGWVSAGSLGQDDEALAGGECWEPRARGGIAQDASPALCCVQTLRSAAGESCHIDMTYPRSRSRSQCGLWAVGPGRRQRAHPGEGGRRAFSRRGQGALGSSHSTRCAPCRKQRETTCRKHFFAECRLPARDPRQVYALRCTLASGAGRVRFCR